jgi:hypothetical protein
MERAPFRRLPRHDRPEERCRRHERLLGVDALEARDERLEVGRLRRFATRPAAEADAMHDRLAVAKISNVPEDPELLERVVECGPDVREVRVHALAVEEVLEHREVAGLQLRRSFSRGASAWPGRSSPRPRSSA